MNWAFVDSDSIVTMTGTAPDKTPASAFQEGAILNVPEGLIPGRSYFEQGEWGTIPEQPSPAHKLDRDAKVWLYDVALDAAWARIERDHRLSACDWTQVADSPVDRDAWAAYRQVLRDVPTQPGFPQSIEWPDIPI